MALHKHPTFLSSPQLAAIFQILWTVGFTCVDRWSKTRSLYLPHLRQVFGTEFLFSFFIIGEHLQHCLERALSYITSLPQRKNREPSQASSIKNSICCDSDWLLAGLKLGPTGPGILATDSSHPLIHLLVNYKMALWCQPFRLILLSWLSCLLTHSLPFSKSREKKEKRRSNPFLLR